MDHPNPEALETLEAAATERGFTITRTASEVRIHRKNALGASQGLRVTEEGVFNLRHQPKHAKPLSEDEVFALLEEIEGEDDADEDEETSDEETLETSEETSAASAPEDTPPPDRDPAAEGFNAEGGTADPAETSPDP